MNIKMQIAQRMQDIPPSRPVAKSINAHLFRAQLINPGLFILKLEGLIFQHRSRSGRRVYR